MKPSLTIPPPRGPVPSWVPLPLHSEYLKITLEKDEFEAARVIRLLKKAMEEGKVKDGSSS